MAVWVSSVLAATGFGALKFGLFTAAVKPEKLGEKGAEKIESLRIRQISVPTFKNGNVHGYVVVRFTALIVTAYSKSLPIKVEDVFVDEAHKAIHAMSADEVTRTSKPDLEKLATLLVERVNTSLNKAVVQRVLIQEIAFVDKKDVRK